MYVHIIYDLSDKNYSYKCLLSMWATVHEIVKMSDKERKEEQKMSSAAAAKNTLVFLHWAAYLFYTAYTQVHKNK